MLYVILYAILHYTKLYHVISLGCPPTRHPAGQLLSQPAVGRLGYCFCVGFLFVSVLYNIFTGIPRNHWKFTRMSSEFHQMFARASNRSTLKKGMATTRPSHKPAAEPASKPKILSGCLPRWRPAWPPARLQA